MNTKTIVRLYQTVKPHQPLIQFRYGLPEINKSEPTLSPSTISGVQTMEDYQLPVKFKRVTMEDAEINAINPHWPLIKECVTGLIEDHPKKHTASRFIYRNLRLISNVLIEFSDEDLVAISLNEEVPLDKKILFLYLENDEIKLKVQSLYFYQVQGQLKITKSDLCYVVIRTDSWTQILKIKFDLSLWKTKIFYMECILPEIVDPLNPKRMVKSVLENHKE